MRFTSQEKKLISNLLKTELSKSHQFDHLTRVAEFSADLARIYKADRKIVVAAVLTHDLGRSELKYRGKQSAIHGAKLAGPMLKKTGYKNQEIQLIKRVVAEHDDPSFHSKLLESRILKDADYLDGFGARGIMRSIVYAGETGGGITEAVERLRKKGKQRLKGLEFIESKRLGWKLHRLTELFLKEFEKGTGLDEVNYSGKLIVIEGISGSGKDTQAELLVKYFKKQGKEAVLVNHPTKFLKKLWRVWRTKVDDRKSEAFLMMADRVRMTREVILPALKEGKVVVSTRSSISAQVYQYEKSELSEFYRYGFNFEPVADLIIYLDISAKEALKRADQRVKAGKEKDRGFFGVKQEEYRKRFASILRNYPNVVKVDGSGDKEEVFRRLASLH